MLKAKAIRYPVVALLLATFLTPCLSQPANTFKATCQDVGMSGRDLLGEGHSVSVGQYSCKVEGGVADGSLETGMVIWEWNKTHAVLQAGNGVIRRPGSIAVYQNSEGQVTVTVVNGKMTGLSGTSKGVYKTATGDMTGLAGKSWTSTFKSIGGGQFVIEQTTD